MTTARQPWLGVADWAAAPPTERRAALEVARRAASGTTHNTYITVADPVDAPEHAAGDGELAGMPFAVKDNIDVAGLATTAGSPLLADRLPQVDATVVSALREAGAVVVGKTNMHELAFGLTSNNATYGPVRNPVDATRSAGGSSGGSAAVVALGEVPFSLSTDTGGSVTVPASFCGVVGFRPSTGRYLGDGVVNLSWTRDTIGIHARSVTDARLVDRVIARTRGAASKPLHDVTLGLPRSRYDGIDPEVADLAERAIDRLRGEGVTFVDVVVPDDLAIGSGPGLELVLYECARTLTDCAAAVHGADRVRDLAGVLDHIGSPDVKGLATMIAQNPLPEEAYAAAVAARSRLRRSYAEAFAGSGVDALLGPTCAALPPPLGEDEVVVVGDREEPLFATLTRNAGPPTVAGLPVLSIPVGRTAGGLAVGMNLEGAAFDDDALLALGATLDHVDFG